MKIDEIMKELNSRVKEFDLEGVEITEDDAMLVMTNVTNGASLDKAIECVLSGIRDTLDEF